MISVRMTSTSNQKSFSFLETATRNYISARLLFLNNQLYDGGIMAHEAIEKIMKAILYFQTPTRSKIKEHVLNKIRKIMEIELPSDFSEYRSAFDYYEECYHYRYPDDPKPQSFSTGTTFVHLLDEIFIRFHKICIDKISVDEIKYKSGIYFYCQDYYISNDLKNIEPLLSANGELNLAEIDEAKNYWHNKGYFKENEKGQTAYPNGMVTQRH